MSGYDTDESGNWLGSCGIQIVFYPEYVEEGTTTYTFYTRATDKYGSYDPVAYTINVVRQTPQNLDYTIKADEGTLATVSEDTITVTVSQSDNVDDSNDETIIVQANNLETAYTEADENGLSYHKDCGIEAVRIVDASNKLVYGYDDEGNWVSSDLFSNFVVGYAYDSDTYVWENNSLLWVTIDGNYVIDGESTYYLTVRAFDKNGYGQEKTFTVVIVYSSK